MTDTPEKESYVRGTCPHCEFRWRARSSAVGRRARCPQCGKVFLAEAVTPDEDAPSVPESATAQPEQIPGYQIDGELGRGGMGMVYRALELSTKRTVALKVMLAGRHATDQQRRRFEREVEIAASLAHPNIARLYASGLHEGHYWFAMEYVEGERLDRFAVREKLGVRTLLGLFVPICKAVNHAHQRGVMHRDLKPGNILVDKQVRPHVLDFGLAKLVDSPAEAADDDVTLAGQVAGTPAYMSPEQTHGDASAVDIRSDVYSLGVMFYRLLTGQSPYGEGETSLAKLFRAINEAEPLPPRRLRKEIPDEVSSIVLKALEKDPARRYQSAGELGRDIHAHLTGQPVTAKQGSSLYMLRKLAVRHRKLAAAVAAVVVLSLGLGTVMAALFAKTRIELREIEKKVQVLQEKIVFLGSDPNSPSIPKRLYVDASAKGAHDGSVWASAYNDLQDALAAARRGTEIWVAAGTYRPDRGGGDRKATFQLKSGVGLYGGFAGSENVRDQRDPEKNKTILSGDLKGDDGVDFANNNENAYHVVRGSGVDANAVLDGFMIRGGLANGAPEEEDDQGAGMLNNSGSPTVRDCVFVENATGGQFGSSGGGMGNLYGAGPHLVGCTFRGNVAAWDGGGMVSSHSCDPTLTNCRFIGNRAANHGGGMFNWTSSAPKLSGCLFVENTAGHHGGAMGTMNGSSTALTACIFVSNSAKVNGGAIVLNKSSASLRQCRFVANRTGRQGGAMQIEGNSKVTARQCAFRGSFARGAGGGMSCVNSKVSLLSCALQGNHSVFPGGGMDNWGSRINLTNCLFLGNGSTNGAGGGLQNGRNTTCLIVNCTFSGNRARGPGDSLYLFENADTTLRNCIIWDTWAPADEENHIGQTRNKSTRFAGCCIQGWTGKLGGEGNFGVDPLFVDPRGPDRSPGTEDDDLRLKPGSPCIDKGDAAALPMDSEDLDGDEDRMEPIPMDLAGSPRVVGGKVDIGAYEFQATGAPSSRPAPAATQPQTRPAMPGPQSLAWWVEQAQLGVAAMPWGSERLGLEYAILDVEAEMGAPAALAKRIEQFQADMAAEPTMADRLAAPWAKVRPHMLMVKVYSRAKDQPAAQQAWARLLRAAGEIKDPYSRQRMLCGMVWQCEKAVGPAEKRAALAAAQAAAVEIPEPQRRCAALAEVSRFQLEAGDAQGARDAEKLIRPLAADDTSRRLLAQLQAKLGQIQAARRTAAAIGNQRRRGIAYVAIASAQAEAGDSAGAKATLKAIPPLPHRDYRRSHGYCDIAHAEAKRGRVADARKTIAESKSIVGNAAHPMDSGWAHLRLAWALKDVGDTDAAKKHLRTAHSVAAGQDINHSLYCGISKAWVDLGEYAQAKAVATDIHLRSSQASALQAIAVGFATAGQTAQAVETASAITDPSRRRRAYEEVAAALSGGGRGEELRAWADSLAPADRPRACLGAAKGLLP